MTESRDEDSLDDLNDLEGAWDLGLQDLFGSPSLPASKEAVAGDYCGRYQLMEEIAHGGMGRVFRAHDERLDRTVAVKILRERLRHDDVMTSRFLEEARIAAQLQHPGVIPVYDVGLDAEARPWFSMKLVEGRTLSELLANRSHPGEELSRFLGIFASVCQAVGYAHGKSVIHRDLKPANVMIGSFGEVQVLDWGFAKILQALKAIQDSERISTPTAAARQPSEHQDSSRSVSGSVLGTPRYMSPEQARGEIERLDERTDVFALGAILCEILCDRTPWGRSTDEDPIKKAARGDLEETQQALETCGADEGLIRLCQHCLSIDAEARPKNAGEVAQAIDDYLAEAEERTRQARVTADAAMASAQHERRAKTLTIILSLVLLTILIGSGAFFWQRESARRENLSRIREGLLAAIQDARGQALQGEWALVDQSLSRARLVLGDEPHAAFLEELKRTEESLAASKLEWQKDRNEREKRKAFSDRLNEIRQTTTEEPGSGGMDYASCFRDFGVDVESLSPEIAYLELIKLPADLREAIRLALDDWALRERALEARDRGPNAARRQEPSRSTSILELAQLIDHDGWRRRLRAAVLENLPEELKAIAEEAAFTGIDPKDAQLLATTLHREGEASLALDVLLSSWKRHPDDTWLNHHIARIAHGQRGKSLAADDDKDITHAYMAVALSPESPFLREHLCQILFDLERNEEALDLLRSWDAFMDDSRIAKLSTDINHREAVLLLEAALAGRPDSTILYLRLGSEHLRVADFAKAEEVARRGLLHLNNDPELTGFLAETLLDSGNIEAALELFEKGENSESLRPIRQKVLRWRQMSNRRQPIEVPLLRERARLLELSGDSDGATDAWLEILAGHGSERIPGDGPRGRGNPHGLPPRGPREGGRRPGPRVERSPQQDALAGVLRAAYESAGRRSELIEAALVVLRELKSLSEERRDPRMMDVEVILEDRRIRSVLESMRTSPHAAEFDALNEAWMSLNERFRPDHRE